MRWRRWNPAQGNDPKTDGHLKSRIPRPGQKTDVMGKTLHHRTARRARRVPIKQDLKAQVDRRGDPVQFKFGRG